MKHNYYYDDYKMSEDSQVIQDLDYCLNLFKYPVMENWVYKTMTLIKKE